MANKIKQTSTKISTLASNTLNNKNASHTAKQLAASALSQSSPSKQTGAAIESKASMILQSQKYNT